MRIRSTASAYVVRRSSRGESPQADVRSPSSASSRTSSSRGLVGCRLQAAAHWVVARLVDIVLTGRCALLGYGVERALHLFAPEFAEYAAGARIGPVRPAAAREGRPEPQRGQEAGEKDQTGTISWRQFDTTAGLPGGGVSGSAQPPRAQVGV